MVNLDYENIDRFELYDSLICVEFNENLIRDEDLVGKACYKKQIIELQPYNDIHTYIAMKTTFWHEFFHYALNFAGYKELSDNEQLIEILARATNQCLTTMRFKNDNME